MTAYRILQWIPAYNEQVSAHIVAQVLRDQASMLANGHEHGFAAAHSCDLVWLRNRAMSKALAGGWDFLLMQDADVFSECPGGPLIRLLGTALETDATITGACVSMRTRPPKANVWGVDGQPVKPGTVFEAEKIGTGMVLINLDKVRKWYGSFTGPCFARRYYTEEIGGATFNRMDRAEIGLDVWFSKIVRAHGQSIWCDARIPTTHVDGTFRHDFDGKTIPDLAGNQGTDPADPGEHATAAQAGD